MLTTTHSVPGDIASTFQHQFGVDVSGVSVRRGPAVSTLASGLAAKAFTQGGEVYLPDEAGDASGHETRALLAHELVHATQQRFLGDALPAEDTDEGRQLEAAAVAAEDWFRGSRSDPPALIHRPPPTAGVTSDDLQEYAQRIKDELAMVTEQAGQRLQRASYDAPDLADLVRRELAAGNGAGAEQSFDGAPQGGNALLGDRTPWIQPSPVDGSSGQSVDDIVRQVATSLGSPDMQMSQPVSGPVATEAAVHVAASARMDQLAAKLKDLELKMSRSVLDPDDPSALTSFTEKLYDDLRGRLRSELIIDRERSGRLSDFR